MEKIETGVDKLVDLVNQRKKIAVDEAAKELGVSTVVVQEWADFLEEEGVISLEYSLSKVYIVPKKLSKKEVQKKEKDYSSKKDAFVRKIDSTIKTLDKETTDFEQLRTDFEALKNAVDHNIEDVKEKMKQLSHYEELKNKLDVVILKQKQKFEHLIEQAHKQIQGEEERYNTLIADIQKEKQSMEVHRSKVAEIEKTEIAVKERAEALNAIVQNLHEKLKGEEEFSSKVQSRSAQLKDVAGKIEEDLRSKRERTINPLIKLSEEHSKKITRIQDDVLTKIKKKQDEISKQAGMDLEASEQFKKFFAKKEKLDKLFNDIADTRSGLKKDLIELMNKATAFNLVQQGSNVKVHMAGLEKQYKEIEAKKEKLKSQIEKLNVYLAK